MNNEPEQRTWCGHRLKAGFGLLFTGKTSQIGIGCEKLAQRLLDVPPGLNVLAHLVDPRVGFRSTRRFPQDIKVRVRASWPSPFAQRQEGLPRRVRLKERAPGNESGRNLKAAQQLELALAPAGGCVSVNFKLQIQTSEFMVQSAKMAVLQDIGIIRPDLEGSRGPAVCALLTCWRNG